MGILSRWFGTRQEVTRAKTVASALSGSLFAGPTKSGTLVNEQTALGLSALWCGLRTISQDVGCLDPVMFKEAPDGTSRKAKRHPLVKVLHEPNPEMTGITFRETLQAHALLYGNAFAEVIRDNAGTVLELWPIHPLNVVVYRESTTNALTYRVTISTYGAPPGELGTQVELSANDVLHIPGLSPDGSVGYRLLTMARETLGFGTAAMSYGSSFFRNACRPSGTLESPTTLSDSARDNLRKSYSEVHSGPDNAARLMVLEEGLKFNPMMITNEQGQYKDLLNWIIYEIARFLVIPPPKLMSLEQATWGNLTELNRAYLSGTLRPWLEKWEAEADRKLLKPSERDAGYFIEFDTSTLLRAVQSERYTAYALALANKPFRTVNEVRAEENLPPIDGGDELAAPTPPAPQPQPGDVQAEDKPQDSQPDEGHDEAAEENDE